MAVADALALLADGRPAAVAEASRRLRDAAAEGDAEAHERLALLQAAGVGLPQDWSGAFDSLARAAALGSVRARGQLHVLAAPPGAASPSATADHAALRAAIRIEAWLAVGEKRVLSPAPRAVAMDGFLPRAACAWLIGLAHGRTRRAMIYPDGATEAVPSPDRTNTGLELTFTDCDVVVILLRARIAATLGLPAAAFETTQILHYRPGETYRAHLDALDPSRPDVAVHGQRIATFLIYLNDDFTGGETDFPRVGLRHKGETGGAFYFANIDAAGAPDPRTLHAGLPPITGEKWLLSQWIRNRARI